MGLEKYSLREMNYVREQVNSLEKQIKELKETEGKMKIKTVYDELSEIYKACNDSRVFEIQTKIRNLLKKIDEENKFS